MTSSVVSIKVYSALGFSLIMYKKMHSYISCSFFSSQHLKKNYPIALFLETQRGKGMLSVIFFNSYLNGKLSQIIFR